MDLTTFLHTLSSHLDALRERRAQAVRRERERRDLQSMGERELADLGIGAGEIGRLVSQGRSRADDPMLRAYSRPMQFGAPQRQGSLPA